MPQFRRLAAAAFRDDFRHHAPGVARLNHGSFGSAPRPVLEAEAAARAAWRANPDAQYFARGEASLDARLAVAAEAAGARVLGAPQGSSCLVENATMATATIAHRWARRSSRPKILLLSVCYKAVAAALGRLCGGAELVFAPVRFPEDVSDAAVLDSLEAALRAHRPRFAMLDHISSQPSLLLPVHEMVTLCRRYGVEEVAVDGAHAAGSLAALSAPAIGADFYFTNLHKWAMAPPTVAALYVADQVRSTPHAAPSWAAGEGVVMESRWPGTRDFAAFLAVPEAIDYLERWRSEDGLRAWEYNARGVASAAAMLEDAWGVQPVGGSCCGMRMVRLPRSVDLSGDRPGEPSTGVRVRLREEFGIEAAVGGFGEHGGFVRLSHAVYNIDEDYERLRDAVLTLAKGG